MFYLELAFWNLLYQMISSIIHILYGSIYMKQKVDKLVVAREWRGGEGGLTVKGYELSFWNGENALKLHNDGCTTSCIY